MVETEYKKLTDLQKLLSLTLDGKYFTYKPLNIVIKNATAEQECLAINIYLRSRMLLNAPIFKDNLPNKTQEDKTFLKSWKDHVEALKKQEYNTLATQNIIYDDWNCLNDGVWSNYLTMPMI